LIRIHLPPPQSQAPSFTAICADRPGPPLSRTVIRKRALPSLFTSHRALGRNRARAREAHRHGNGGGGLGFCVRPLLLDHFLRLIQGNRDFPSPPLDRAGVGGSRAVLGGLGLFQHFEERR
jgi:hypothetical protein